MPNSGFIGHFSTLPKHNISVAKIDFYTEVTNEALSVIDNLVERSSYKVNLDLHVSTLGKPR